MSPHAESVRNSLSQGPLSGKQLTDSMAISQSTLSRVVAELGAEIVRFRLGRTIHYALRDAVRGLPEIPVYRVDEAGCIHELGTLLPVRAEGFVLQQSDGSRYSEGLPWWLLDLRPQGYLGRAFAARYAGELNLPSRLVDWNDSHALRALLAHGEDAVGHLLLGEAAQRAFVHTPLAPALEQANKLPGYAALAQAAVQGDLAGSSAGGEQPKFTCYAQTEAGPRHVLVKFTEGEMNPVSQRWGDLLLAEHLALSTLNQAGIPAARTKVLDGQGQRFLEVERFDRVGALGRRGLLSLTALDAQFLGLGQGGWPALTHQLARLGLISPEAADQAALYWAFGKLIGNSDMHNGNLSFFATADQVQGLTPAYDMLPMAFAPRPSGALVDSVAAMVIRGDIKANIWRQALALAQGFMQCLGQARDEAPSLSERFAPCIAALHSHLADAQAKIARLG